MSKLYIIIVLRWGTKDAVLHEILILSFNNILIIREISNIYMGDEITDYSLST